MQKILSLAALAGAIAGPIEGGSALKPGATLRFVAAGGGPRLRHTAGGDRSLAGDGAPTAAQDELLNLSGRRLRQLRHERHRVRRLEVRQPFARERPQLL